MNSSLRLRSHARRANRRRAPVRLRLESLEARTLLTALTIAQENQLPGTLQSVWDVAGSGDSSLQGYATDMSVNQGKTIAFKINDSTNNPYHIDIYRMGWYQGDGARLVTTIPSSQTLDQVQPGQITDPLTGLTDAGNWAVSASWNVPADATSGVYFARLQNEVTGGANMIIFIVRADASHSQLLFQTSDATWQAYNFWGSESLYFGSTLAGRASAVSYNRPFQSVHGDHSVFSDEYPMIRWVEQNGYDVSYTTDMDSDRYGALVKNHQVFMSVGHDEYWSGGQRQAIQDAVGAGVNLAFFSGNEGFWKTYWAASTADPNNPLAPYRTLVCYKESIAGAIPGVANPLIWTGTWRDPRSGLSPSGGLPENALTGTLPTVDQNSPAALTIPAAQGQDRLWRNTSVASLAPGASAAMPVGTVGYEWDVDADNGFRPAGLIDLSTTVVANAPVLQDYATTVAPATATHHLTMYRAPSGALVFGAGTVQWSWGLDANHDGSTGPADSRMQQATVNLLADMGVQATSLQSGLIPATRSTDATAPTSVVANPAAASSVTAGSQVVVTGTATDAGGGVVAGIEVSVDGGSTWHPATGTTSWSYVWIPAKTGAATILSRATDDSCNTEKPGPGLAVSVTPAVAPPPNVYSIWSVSATPQAAATPDPNPVELGVKFRSDVAGLVTSLRFYKGVDNTGVHVGHLWTSTGTLLATATFTGETVQGWQRVDFSTPVPVQANTTYVASYHADAGDYASSSSFFLNRAVNSGPLHALADGTDGPDGVYQYGPSAFPTASNSGMNYWVDVVFSAGATTPPAVTSETPAPSATSVAVGATVSATFNQAVVAASVVATLQDSKGNLVATVPTYNAATNTIALAPVVPLAVGATYTATVSAAIDLNGHSLPSPFSWTFTTMGGVDTIWSTTAVPVNPAAADNSAIEVGLRFQSDVAGTVAGVRFYKGAGNVGAHVGHLWSNAGTMLGTVTFASETVAGWQEADFSTPIAIAANTSYIVSYYAPTGHYAADNNAFATVGVDSPPLHALANGPSGLNGLYLYGSDSFPSGAYLATNYWVDVAFNPGAGAKSTALSATSGSGVYGGPLTLTATLTANGQGVAGETAVFSVQNGSTVVPVGSAVTNANGVATLSGVASISLGAGTDPVLVSFAGDSGNAASSGAGTLTITPAPLTVAAANQTAIYGSALPTLTGTLTGVRNNDPITATYTTTATAGSPVGSYAIAPALVDPKGLLGNYTVTINPGKLSVTPAPLTVVAANQSSVYGAPLPTLTGTLTGLQNNDPITATYTTTATAGSPVGSYAIAPALVDPKGLLGNYAVTITPGAFTVTQAGATTTVQSSALAAVVGQSLTFTAVVAAIAPGAGTPTGTVTFLDGSTVLKAVPLQVVNGVDQATFVISTLGSGGHAITAVYSGDTNFLAGAPSPALAQQVGQNRTATTVSSSLNPAFAGIPVTFTAMVAVVGIGVPTGVVTFKDGSTVLGAGTLSASPGGASATFTTTALAASGSPHAITAVYGGDAADAGSASVALSQIVRGPAAILLLDPSGKDAFSASGTANVAVNNGGSIIVDSSNAQAMAVSGSAQVVAPAVVVAGGELTSSHGSLSTPVVHAPATPDPLSLPLPPAPSAVFAAVNYKGGATLTLSPGTYLGGITVAGNGMVVLQPGVYYLKGGGLTITQGGILGAGVLIVNAPLKSTDVVSINTSSLGGIAISPPTTLTGAYAAYNGVALMQDPASHNPITIAGQGVMALGGVLYAPGATLNLSGTLDLGAVVGSPGATITECVLADLKVVGGALTVFANSTPSSTTSSSTGSSGQNGTGNSNSNSGAVTGSSSDPNAAVDTVIQQLGSTMGWLSTILNGTSRRSQS